MVLIRPLPPPGSGLQPVAAVLVLSAVLVDRSYASFTVVSCRGQWYFSAVFLEVFVSFDLLDQ